MTEADGATKLFAPDTAGATPSTATKRVEGTNFSVYFATSIPAPIPSSIALHHWKSKIFVSESKLFIFADENIMRRVESYRASTPNHFVDYMRQREPQKTHPILLAAPEAATAIRVLNDAIYEFKKEFFTIFWTKFAFKQTQVRSEKECQPPLALSPLSLSSCLVAA